MAEKVRLDMALVERGISVSRSQAQAMILSKEILVNGQLETKPARMIMEKDDVTVKEKLRYVSRGGLKLEKALRVFPISLKGKVCLDIGASTGGFTDCMLQHGAKKVYSVDVGYGQLDYSLRSKESVVCMERYNARNLNRADFDEEIEFASMDVSFISIKLILPALYACMASDAQAVALIKPQFEAGRQFVGKNGVVRDEGVRLAVLEDILQFAAQTGYAICGMDYSPIKGPKGNVEFLLWLSKDKWQGMALSDALLQAKTIVRQAQNMQ